MLEDKYKYRGKIESGEWIYGDLIEYESGECAIFFEKFSKYGSEATEIAKRTMVRPETVRKSTGLKDIEGNELWEGDVFISKHHEHLEDHKKMKMVVKFGEYMAYCPIDKTYMRNVGFYVEIINKDIYMNGQDMQMPLGETEEYAIKIGDIYQNPELLEVEQ